ncbi:hypothetical protein KIPB_005045 [Kipferlia bialata]|uniref:Uncharacterized protein n=1 Tax=Kipferlia bialata TaxID=797122 RepID=A0A9K3CXV3_9EUKA|nr:hypothetical protein KIPB_005045 [Kipferlia bialata]|eukprot:g5045.t1
MNCVPDFPIVEYAYMYCEDPGCDEFWPLRADGCSIPVPYVKDVSDMVFGSECELHDLCYAAPGNTQDACDVAFYQNLMSVCQYGGIASVLKRDCELLAYTMYSAVHLIGKQSYVNGNLFSQRHCKELYVDSILESRVVRYYIQYLSDNREQCVLDNPSLTPEECLALRVMQDAWKKKMAAFERQKKIYWAKKTIKKAAELKLLRGRKK